MEGKGFFADNQISMLKFISHFIQYVIFFFLVFIILALLLFAIFYEPAVHILARDYLQKSLGAPVSINQVRFDIKNTSLTLYNVKIENPTDFPQGDVANISKIYIDFEIADLEDKLFHAEQLYIECKNVHIMKDAEGRYNWFQLKTFSDNRGGALEEDKNLLEKWVRKIPVENYFTGWRLQIDDYILDLGHSVYRDFSTPVPQTLSTPLRIEKNSYKNIHSMREVIRIIAWETLLIMEQGNLKEAFELIQKKVETRLGSKRDFIKEWKREN